MDEYTKVKCKSCPAMVIFARNDRTEELMPIDAQPTPDGNILLRPGGDGTPRYYIERNPGNLFGKKARKSHFATCPNASLHRKLPSRKRKRNAP